MTDIKIIEKKLKRQNNIFNIIIAILILGIIYSKFLKYNDIIDCYFPYILIFALFIKLTGMFNIIKIKKLKNDKSLKRELNNIILFNQNGYMLTENFIIPNLSKKRIVDYNDIILIYTKKHRSKGGMDEYLYVVLNNGKKEIFMINTTTICVGYDADPYNFTNIILEKNKNVLVGNTEENRQIIFDKYGIKFK